MRLTGNIQQHFIDHQQVYTRNGVINRVQADPVDPKTIHTATDYALKGIKANRLPNEETLLYLPRPKRDVRPRPFITTQPDRG